MLKLLFLRFASSIYGKFSFCGRFHPFSTNWCFKNGNYMPSTTSAITVGLRKTIAIFKKEFKKPSWDNYQWRYIWIKAMRLSKNFGLSTFPVFRPYRYFDGRNKSGILTLVSNVRKFRETYRKSYRNTEIFDICRKFRYIFDIFDIRRLFSTISTFSGTFRYKMALKIVKMALKMVENHEYYTGIFDISTLSVFR